MGSCYFATFFAWLLKMLGQFLLCQLLKVLINHFDIKQRNDKISTFDLKDNLDH